MLQGSKSRPKIYNVATDFFKTHMKAAVDAKFIFSLLSKATQAPDFSLTKT